jgi:hypothetical protein
MYNIQKVIRLDGENEHKEGLKRSFKGLRKVGYLDHHFLLSDRLYDQGQEQRSKDDWDDQDEDNEIEEDEEGSEVDSVRV